MKKILFLLMVLLAVPLQAFAAPSQIYLGPPTRQVSPIGFLDTCDSGWVFDQNTPGQSVTVHLYADIPAGQPGSSVFMSVNTDTQRTDVNEYLGRSSTENYGYKFDVPTSLKDGRQHKIYAYGIDTTEKGGFLNVLLTGAPKVCSWPSEGASIGATGTIQITSPASQESWQLGSTKTIKWQFGSSGVARPGNTVDIHLEPYIACLYESPSVCKIATPAPYTIATGVPNSGEYVWNIPSSISERYLGEARIRVSVPNSDWQGTSGVFKLGTQSQGGAIKIEASPYPFVGLQVGRQFSASINVSGGSGSYKYEFTSGALPSGLSIQPLPAPMCATPVGQANTCPVGQAAYLISGTPTTAGVSDTVFRVIDSLGGVAEKVLNFEVLQAGTLTVTSPAQNAEWSLGKEYKISWTGSSGDKRVSIYLEPYYACLYTNPSCALALPAPFPIAENIQDKGEFAWFVPTSLPPMYRSSARVLVVQTPGDLRSYSGVIKITESTTTGPVATGYVDAVQVRNGKQYIVGWAFQSNAQPTCVKVSLSGVNSQTTSSYNKEFCPTENRTDAAEWIRKTYGSSFDIKQPMGFVIDVEEITQTPGVYKIASVSLSQSLSTNLEMSPLAQKTFTIGSVVDSKIFLSAQNQTGVVGQSMNMTVAASGGTAPYSWSLVSGSLPPGTGLAFETIVCIQAPCVSPNEKAYIKGTPTAAGTYKFALRASDSLGRSATGDYSIVVQPGSSSKVMSPAKGDVWYLGETRQIKWSGLGNNPITITLHQASCRSNPCVALAPYVVASNVANTGNFSWSIPQDLPEKYLTVNYLIISDANGNSVSSEDFSIKKTSQSDLGIISPYTGAKWMPGSQQVIKWNGPAGGTVTIYAYSYPECLDAVPACAVRQAAFAIASNVANTGSYTWNIPSDILVTGRSKIRIEFSTGASLESGYFYITTPSTEKLTITLSRGAGVVYPLNQSLSIPIVISGGSGKYKLSLSSGGLPSGLLLNQTSDLACTNNASDRLCVGSQYYISGSPAVPGDFKFSLTAIDETSGATGAGDFTLVVRGSAASSVVAGQVVVGTSGTVYVINEDGEKYGFISLQDLTSRGYTLRQVVRVDQSVLDSLPTVNTFARPAGTNFKYANAPAVYYLNALGCKEAYPSLTTLRAWKISTSSVVTIPASETYPDCSPTFVRLPDGLFVKVSGSPTVYRVRGSAMSPYSSMDALRRDNPQNTTPTVITRNESSLYSMGDVIN